MTKLFTKLTSLLLLISICFAFTACALTDGNDDGKGGEAKISSTYVEIEINPSIELTVNEDGNVVSVYGANDDAKVLLYEEEDEIVGKKYEEAISHITEIAIELGYLSEDNPDFVTTVVSANAADAEGIKSKIDAKIVSTAEGLGLTVSADMETAFTLLAELERFKEENPDSAAIQALTPAKYKLALSAAENGEITAEAAAELSEQALIEEVKKAHSTMEAYATDAYLEAKARALINELINDHQSDYDKVRALHDYLKSNLEYDTVAASSRSMTDRNVADAHTIVGALLKHKCVCEGFAKAMKYLCDKISLECYVVCGKGNSPLAMGPHAWNIVRINGYYHHVDVTWDNQYSDSAEIPNYGYLNLSDDEIAKDHTWDRRFYPACPSSPYNFFRVNDALLDSKAQLESFLYNSFQNEEEFVMFRVVRGSMLEREINGCLPDCIQRASDRCKYIRASSFQYGCVPEQLTFFVRPNYEYQ